MEEKWLKVKGYEEFYEISDLGRIKSLISNGLILKQSLDKDGYCVVTLKRKQFKVHRLVAMTFIPNPNNLPQVNHKDENKTNNTVDNLEWCDAKYNINYGNRNEKTRNKLLGTSYSTERVEKARKSQKEYWVTHSNPNAKKVICDGKLYDSIKECADFYKIKPKTMSRWLNGKYPMPKKFIDLGLRFVNLKP